MKLASPKPQCPWPWGFLSGEYRPPGMLSAFAASSSPGLVLPPPISLRTFKGPWGETALVSAHTCW